MPGVHSMNTRTANPDPAQRWGALAKATVRKRPPVHDGGTAASAPTKAPARSKTTTTPVIAAPTVAVVASRYPSLQLAAAMLGRTEKALERKIERGVLIEGKHYYRRDGGIHIDIEAYEAWVRTGK